MTDKELMIQDAGRAKSYIDAWYKAALDANLNMQFAVRDASFRFVHQMDQKDTPSFNEELMWIILFGAMAAIPGAGQALILSYSFVNNSKNSVNLILKFTTPANYDAMGNMLIRYKDISESASKYKDLIGFGADISRNAISRAQQTLGAFKSDNSKIHNSGLRLEDIKDVFIQKLVEERAYLNDLQDGWNSFVDENMYKNELEFSFFGNPVVRMNIQPIVKFVTSCLGDKQTQIDQTLLEFQFEMRIWRSYFRSEVVVDERVLADGGISDYSPVTGLKEPQIKYLMSRFHKFFNGSTDSYRAWGARVNRVEAFPNVR